MRILVTGGSGFLGSHLCQELLRLNHEVICLDNFYTGSRRNVLHLLDNDRFELVRHDVTVPIHIEVDGIFNLACPASPIHYQRNPVQREPDITKAALKLNWKPKVNRRIGLMHTIEYFKSLEALA